MLAFFMPAIKLCFMSIICCAMEWYVIELLVIYSLVSILGIAHKIVVVLL